MKLLDNRLYMCTLLIEILTLEGGKKMSSLGGPTLKKRTLTEKNGGMGAENISIDHFLGELMNISDDVVLE